jgi:DNA polymerase-1
VFVRADYSQLQLVIAAWIAQDQEMIRTLNQPDGDIHQRTADAVGCSRQQAKAVNFGFLFGAGAETFQREQRKNGVFLTLNQAYEYRKTFLRTYRGIRSWHHRLGQWGDETVIYDPSGSGRRRTAVFSNNVKANTPVQMVEAHGFKRALTLLHDSRDQVPSARLVMMVHDELIAECDVADAEAVGAWLKDNMVYAMQPLVDGVAVRVDATIVASYSDEDKKNGRSI